MSVESRKNGGTGKMVKVLIRLPEDVHGKAQDYQAKLTGRKGGKVTFAEACSDLIARAVKRIKISTKIL